MTAPRDGATLYDGDVEWEYVVDTDDEGRTRGWWTCGRCGGTASGDRERAAHVCRAPCECCDRPMVYEYDADGGRWVVADGGLGCEGTDDGEHHPELP